MRKRRAAIGVRAGLVLWLGLAAGAAPAAPPPGTSWDWQLGDRVRLRAGVQVFDLDPDGPGVAQLARIGKAGGYAICYVSVGTVESYRDDAGDFPPEVVGRVYGDWPDERFLDLRRLDVLLPLMKARFARCKAAGFDAVEPDNMDVHDNDSGFPVTRGDTLRYVRALAEMAHAMGLEIGQKNVPELTGDLVGVMDFAITESCWQDGWCGDVAPYVAAGKPVFDAEYTDRPINFKKACAGAAKGRISMILKDRDLTARRRACAN